MDIMNVSTFLKLEALALSLLYRRNSKTPEQIHAEHLMLCLWKTV